MDFVIKDGVLKKYMGISGVMVVPDGVREIANYIDIDRRKKRGAKTAPLTGVVIPASVTVIGKSAFDFCHDIESVVVAADNKTYRSEGDCIIEIATGAVILGGKSGEIPDGVTAINDYAFYSRKGLKSLKIPASVTKIGTYACSGCTDLESLTVAADNETYRSEGNCIIEKATDAVVLGCKNSKIPDGARAIVGCAFSTCTGMWGGLKELRIPASVTFVDPRAFSACPSIEHIVVDDGNDAYISETDCLIDARTNTLTLGCKNSVIPFVVTTIGKHAFDMCSYLFDVDIPNTVRYIESEAFSGCGLSSVIIPNGVEKIESEAFFSCESLESVTIPESVDFIGEGAFSYCNMLKDVTLPKSWADKDASELELLFTHDYVIDGEVLGAGPNSDEVGEIKYHFV